jgi:hypothetical protein
VSIGSGKERVTPCHFSFAAVHLGARNQLLRTAGPPAGLGRARRGRQPAALARATSGRPARHRARGAGHRADRRDRGRARRHPRLSRRVRIHSLPAPAQPSPPARSSSSHTCWTAFPSKATRSPTSCSASGCSSPTVARPPTSTGPPTTRNRSQTGRCSPSTAGAGAARPGTCSSGCGRCHRPGRSPSCVSGRREASLSRGPSSTPARSWKRPVAP